MALLSSGGDLLNRGYPREEERVKRTFGRRFGRRRSSTYLAVPVSGGDDSF